MNDRSIRFSRVTAPLRGISRSLGMKIAVLICGIFMGCSSIGGIMTPFATAYVAAVPHGYSVLAGVGAIVGCFLPFNEADRLRSVATVIAVAGIRWACGELKKLSAHPAFIPCAAMGATVLTGSVISGSIGAKLSYDIALYAADGVLAAAGAYFIARAFDSVRAGRLYAMERQECTALIIAVCMTAAGLCRMNIYGFSIGRAVILLAMLNCARSKKEIGGAIAGIACGAVLAVSGSSLAVAGMCAIAGLAAGVFSYIGTLATAVAAFAVMTLASFMSGNINVFLLAEMLAASAAFKIIPEVSMASLFEKIGIVRTKSVEPLATTLVAQKLEGAAKALLSVSDTVDMVSRKLDKKYTPGIEQIYRQSTENVCGRCPISKHCWECAREETQNALQLLTPILKENGSLSAKTLPMEFRQRCARSDEMMDEINRNYAELTARENARQRVAHVRSVIGDQLGGVSLMLTDLAEKTQHEDVSDDDAAAAVSEALHRSGYIPESVRCIVNSAGRLSITAKVGGRRNRAIARNELIYELEDALDMELSKPVIEGGAEFTLTTGQLPNLQVEFGAAQHCCNNERLCGDAYEAFLDDDGNAFMIISDGMGSGGRAAVDSAMTCGLTGRLLRAGFGFAGAMKVINSALLVKSEDESLATLDITKVNLFTGEAQLCKAGAVKTYIISSGEIRRIDKESLPLGILREVEFAQAKEQLSDGDIVIMVSDGVPDEDDWLEKQLAACEVTDMRAFARSLLAKSRAVRKDGDDDITVLVARINAA